MILAVDDEENVPGEIPDAILHRLVHNANRINLTGESMRETAFELDKGTPPPENPRKNRNLQGLRPRSDETGPFPPWNARKLCYGAISGLFFLNRRFWK